MSYTYEQPRPLLTVDVVFFADRSLNVDRGERDWKKTFRESVDVLLIKRRDEPFQGEWALPGGGVHEHEPLKDAAARELEEETGVTGLHLVQVCAIGTPHRDRRGHTVTIVYTAYLSENVPIVKAGDDATELKWVRLINILEPNPNQPVPLAFDHRELIINAYNLWIT